jgi:Tol biopolymer transport system component
MLGYQRDRGTRLALYRRAANGSGDEELLLDAGKHFNAWYGSWSPDGRWVLATRRDQRPGFENDVVALRAGTDTAPIEVVASSLNEGSPALSPDGRWLAYTSYSTGRSEVYVATFPDTRGESWQVSLEGGVHPRWSPDGRELYYVANGHDFIPATGDIMVASVRTAPAFQVVERSVFVPRLTDGDRYYWEFEVHPDGQRLLMMRQPPVPKQLVIVENFFEELKRKVPR